MFITRRNIFIAACALLLVFAGCSEEEESTECTTTEFTFDGGIHRLCGIDAVGNHIQIQNLHLNGGTFTVFARTNADGTGGGTFKFSGSNSNIEAKYRDGGATATNTDSFTEANFLIGFHQESPAVHVIVKAAESIEALEEANSLIEIEPGDWTNQGAPASEQFYYQGTGSVSLQSVKVFYEEHHH